jgi:hypothetical protein
MLIRAAIVVLLVAGPAMAQEGEGPTFGFSTNVFQTIDRRYNLEIERGISRSASGFVELGWTEASVSGNASIPLRGPTLGLGARFYVLGGPMAGIWAGIEVLSRFLTQGNGGFPDGQLGLGAGAMAGVTWPLFGHLYLSGGIGYAMLYGSEDGSAVRAFTYFPRIRVNAGLAF